ncbi:uncharacterized protein LOC117118304 [Anneissia japonica]|uniref:uncharacterized protein LOC117118304 n=1 Tax=Anneissia japonica TaxID=1529436 RepID=UPI001425975F|nr:uncharacterized protein LOC117118304 [Anneissia japonica]
MMSSRSIANTTHNTEKMMRISGLSECTEYAVDLRVLNDKEFKSPWSEAINITTLPSVPIFVSTNSTILETSFTMKWHTLASCNSGTDLLYHYRLNYVKSNDEYRSGNTSDTEVEITISDDVEPCTEFSFHVSVSFMEVIGQASSIKLSTDAELPGVPEMISAEYSGGSINVEWHPPVNNQCPVSYTVILVSGNVQISKVTEDTRVTFTAEDGISSDRNYTVKLAAMTAKGRGSYLVVNVNKISSECLSDTSAGSSSQAAIIVLAILLVLSLSVISTLLWKLRKFKRQNKRESVNQQQDDDAYYINQFPKVNQTSQQNKTEDAYMDLGPTEQDRRQGIYTDLEKTYEVVDTKQ